MCGIDCTKIKFCGLTQNWITIVRLHWAWIAQSEHSLSIIELPTASETPALYVVFNMANCSETIVDEDAMSDLDSSLTEDQTWVLGIADSLETMQFFRVVFNGMPKDWLYCCLCSHLTEVLELILKQLCCLQMHLGTGKSFEFWLLVKCYFTGIALSMI